MSKLNTLEAKLWENYRAIRLNKHKRRLNGPISTDALHRLEDDVIVVFRVNVPPLRLHWQCRSFDLDVPAYVCKANLIQPLITWELLDRIMELPLEQGTAQLQKHVCEMLKLPQFDDAELA